MRDDHPYVQADWAPGCDVCREPVEAHDATIRQYEVAWRAVVTGTEEIWAHTGNEARQRLLSNQVEILKSREAVGRPYDGVLDTPAGHLLRVTRVTRKAGDAP